jgi:hypothetical protein
VYNLGSAEDLLEMVKRENILISYPHPRSKNNTGFPDGFKEKDYFKDPTFHSIGFRWGMGIDRSERRLCEYRCLALLDDISNWQADLPTPPKYLLAISEVQEQTAHDDIYASAPVSYLHLASLPTPGRRDRRARHTEARGLLRHVRRSAHPCLLGAGHGQPADDRGRRGVDIPARLCGGGLGRRATNRAADHLDHRPTGVREEPLRIPFDATGKKWVRFAAWDTAGNGAAVQPVKLNLPAK